MTSYSKKLVGILFVSISIFGGISYAKDAVQTITMDTNIKQAFFTSPELAAQAITDAISERNKDELGKILGLNSYQLLPLKDIKQEKIEKYQKAYSTSHILKPDGEDKFMLEIGKENWTFPIPIIKGAKGWYFDTEAGKNKIRIRRIGRNELAVMQVVLAYNDAQLEYASKDRNNNGKLEYAQKLISTDDKHDGLYWNTAESEPLSPLGSLFASDTPETAYHGYYYRILTSQGDAAKGGAEDYVVDGRMTGGFALIASPAVYGRTGVMSFMINKNGILYQQDLGQNSTELATSMQNFNPDAGWASIQ